MYQWPLRPLEWTSGRVSVAPSITLDDFAGEYPEGNEARAGSFDLYDFMKQNEHRGHISFLGNPGYLEAAAAPEAAAAAAAELVDHIATTCYLRTYIPGPSYR